MKLGKRTLENEEESQIAQFQGTGGKIQLKDDKKKISKEMTVTKASKPVGII